MTKHRAARTAKRLGAAEVQVVYRRSSAEMPAYPEEVAKAEQEGIKIQYLTMPVGIDFHDSRAKLECVRTKLGDKGRD